MSRGDAYDDLTGLANLATLESRLQTTLAQQHRPGRRPALLVINLDRFHQVNAGLGRCG